VQSSSTNQFKMTTDELTECDESESTMRSVNVELDVDQSVRDPVL
jgi:hypothetical protein